MSRAKITCSFLTLAALFGSAVAVAKEGERHLTLQDDVASAEHIRINMSAGELLITGIDGNILTAEITANCQLKKDKDSCAKLLKELGWVKKAGSLTEFTLSPFDISDYDDMNIQVKLGIPKTKKLDVNLSAGELRLVGTSACLNAEVNAGEIQINLPESQVATAELASRVGDVKISTPKLKQSGERSMLVGATLRWDEGSGSCHVKAKVLAGEVQLTLN